MEPVFPLKGGPLLDGRRAIVTGAARGIGAATADLFEQAGASVARFDVSSAGGIINCDVTDEEAVRRSFGEAEAGGVVTDVVHAAGIAILGTVADTSAEDFRRVIDVNLTGAFLIAREAARRLPRGGNIVFVASQAGLKGGALWSAYCASKAGLLRLADCLVEELAPQGIRVNCISPGSVETEMAATTMAEVARRTGSTLNAVRSRYQGNNPMGRFAQPEEIGAVAVALCSGLLSYVNGANIVADGGELSR